MPTLYRPRLRHRLVSFGQCALLFNVALATPTACGGNATQDKKPAVSRSTSESLRATMIEDVVPTADGSAYARGIVSGIWYLTGSSAIRVHASGDSSTRSRFAQALLQDLQPTTDGGAYAYGFQGSIWRLKADTAYLVVERSGLTSVTLPGAQTERFWWAMYVHERRLRRGTVEELRSAEDAANSAEEPPE